MAPKPKAALFLNPQTAGGRNRPEAAIAILAQQFELAVHAPCGIEAMRATVVRAIREGAGVVIAGGGDGTVNLVANAIADSVVVLGILPLGTANDFARHIGLPGDPTAAARRIVEGRVRRYDALAANGCRFCTVGGIGLVTECAVAAHRLKARESLLGWCATRLGTAIYPIVAAARISFGSHRPWPIKLSWKESDGTERAVPSMLSHGMFFTNQRRLGGSLTLSVNAQNDDGAFEICILHATSRFSLAKTLLAARLARPLGRSVTTKTGITRARIEAAQEIGFMGDGELLGTGKHFELEILPGKLAVVG